MIVLITNMKLNIKDLLSHSIISLHNTTKGIGIHTTTHPMFADISSKTKGAGIMFFSLFQTTLSLSYIYLLAYIRMLAQNKCNNKPVQCQCFTKNEHNQQSDI